MGHNSEKKKNMGQLFFHGESIYEKFQDPSVHCSKVIGGIKKRDTHTRTQKLKTICYTNFFKAGVIKRKTHRLMPIKKNEK